MPFPEESPIDSDFWQEVAIRRSDSVDPGGESGQDLLHLQGNPDRYGGQPAIVRVPANNPPAKFPAPDVKTGVTREG